MNYIYNVLCMYYIVNFSYSQLENSIDVCFCRLMSQLPDVNIQSSVAIGMFLCVVIFHVNSALLVGRCSEYK